MLLDAINERKKQQQQQQRQISKKSQHSTIHKTTAEKSERE